MNKIVSMNLGERRHIKLQAHSRKQENFEIIDASYILAKTGETSREDEGKCEINEHILDMVISPKKKGQYTLEITYKIADEILIDIVDIVVK
jgi:hypothetical protein